MALQGRLHQRHLITLHGDGTITSRTAAMFDTEGGGFMGRRSTPAGGSWKMIEGDKVLVTILLSLTGRERSFKDTFNSAGGVLDDDGLIIRMSYLAEFDQMVRGRYQRFTALNRREEAFIANSNSIPDEPVGVAPGPSGTGWRIETSELPLSD